MKTIKLKLVAALVAAAIMSSFSIPVYATPLTEEQQQELNAVKAEYDAVLYRMAEITGEIAIVNDTITNILVRIEENDLEMERLDGEIKAKNIEIATSEAELLKKETEYGARLRAMYKQGNTGVLQAILSSESIADLIARADAIIKFAKIDKQLLDEIQRIKDVLVDQKEELDHAKNEVALLKADNLVKLEEAEVKKNEAEGLLEELELEENKIIRNLAMAEMYFIGDNDEIIADPSSSDVLIQQAITNLREARTKIITDSTDAKIVTLIERGKTILAQREAARRAAEEAARRAAEERRRQEEAEEERLAQSTPAPSTPAPTTPAPTTPAPSTPAPTAPVSGRGQDILNYGYQFLGVPYVWGGSTPRGFDCSGLTQYVYRQFGINIPRVASAQASVGTRVAYSDLQAGDLVFFGSGSITHVGIYISNGNMLHSPRPGKSVEITTMRYHKFITARRLVN